MADPGSGSEFASASKLNEKKPPLITMIQQILFKCLYLNYSQGSRMDFLTFVLIFISIHSGLPTKDQTSETIVGICTFRFLIFLIPSQQL